MPFVPKPWYVARPLCISKYAFGYRRTLEHLKRWPVELPSSVKKVTMSLSRVNQRELTSPHHGTRLFLYENIPQLKYHNPNIEFIAKQKKSEQSSITFEFGDGGSYTMETTGLRQKAIQETLQSLLNTNSLASNTQSQIVQGNK